MLYTYSGILLVNLKQWTINTATLLLNLNNIILCESSQTQRLHNIILFIDNLLNLLKSNKEAIDGKLSKEKFYLISVKVIQFYTIAKIYQTIFLK